MWDSFARGVQCAIFSDVDVQVFPGWTELPCSCVVQTPFCFTSRPGLFVERTKPINSGFIAMRGDFAALSIILDVMADMDAQFAASPSELAENRVYCRNEQDVMSELFANKFLSMASLFSPEIVHCGMDYGPRETLKLKVHHAASSDGMPKPEALYHIWAKYYSFSEICLNTAMLGPPHPCCFLFGQQRTVFESPSPAMPPFSRNIYGLMVFNPDWGGPNWQPQFSFPHTSHAYNSQTANWCMEYHEILKEAWVERYPFKEFVLGKT